MSSPSIVCVLLLLLFVAAATVEVEALRCGDVQLTAALNGMAQTLTSYHQPRNIMALLVFKCSSNSEEEEVSSDPFILANSFHVTVLLEFRESGTALRKEIILFLSRTVAKRTRPSQRLSVQLFSTGGAARVRVNAYNKNGLCALGVMADDYPLHSAFSLLDQVIDEYQNSYGDSWKTQNRIKPWLYLDEALAKFQYPAAVGVDKFQDDTEIILHESLDSFLAPWGEKLDSLIDESFDLSAATQERLQGNRKQVQLYIQKLSIMSQLMLPSKPHNPDMLLAASTVEVEAFWDPDVRNKIAVCNNMAQILTTNEPRNIMALLVFKCCNNPEESDPVILANSFHAMFLRDDSKKMSLRKEMMVFLSRTVAKRTRPSQRQSVQHFSTGAYVSVNAYNKNGLCALGLMDNGYPLPSAFSLLNQVIDEYQNSYGDSWKTEDSIKPWLYLDEALAKFQYPAAVGVDRFQRELHDTEIILHRTLDSFLAPGEKLDSLIEKSSGLSPASRERLLAEIKQVQLRRTMSIHNTNDLAEFKDVILPPTVGGYRLLLPRHITALLVFKCCSSPEEVPSDPVILANAFDVMFLKHFHDSETSLLKEIIVFLSRTAAKRTGPSQLQSIQQPFINVDVRVNAYNKNGLCALGLMADGYPLPSAFSLLNQVIDEHQNSFDDSWKTATTEDSIKPWLYLDEALDKFQCPDAVVVDKFQDDTEVIVHKTLNSVLAPGEDLDSLIEKSSDLRPASRERLQGYRRWHSFGTSYSVPFKCHLYT